MKSQLNKILIVTLVILFFTLSKSYSIEDVTEFTDAITDVREEFNNISEASTEQSKIIDKALKEIDKATEYAQEAINDDNIEDAIKTLEFIQKTLTDVESIIPQEFSSDMSKIDTSAIPKEDMVIVNELTAQMKTAKEKKVADEERISLEYENRGYAQKRRELYPYMGDQLDALWKGGADAEEMKSKINKVKSDISKE